MKKTTINRIIDNHGSRKLTYIGAYAYKLQWHPMAGKCYIVRCKREYLGREWLDWEGNIVNGWEWIQPIDF